MANADVINLIISNVATMLLYMMPVVAVMSGIIFIVSWVTHITLGMARRTFK